MALHNTQCPHCFTSYVISDAQYRASDGMVRCGTCRERFQARFITGEEKTPRFDPRKAFIEPLTEEEKQKPSLLEEANQPPEEFDLADPHTENEDGSTSSTSLANASVEESINSDMSIDIDDTAPVTKISPIDSSGLSTERVLANIRAKQLREKERKASLDAQQQLDLSLPNDQHEARTSSLDDTVLIDEVNSLVDDKLIKNSTPDDSEVIIIEEEKTEGFKAKPTKNKPDAAFQLDKRPRKKRGHWLLIPLLFFIASALVVALLYQLWLKQLLIKNANPELQKRISEVTAPYVSKLSEKGIVLPIRRNLSQLELVSAKTEPHPTRPSTTLLRISLINHAEIAQPLPWLEMTLSDADGRLVSRRNLSPTDYIYKNRTLPLIGARELKRITIELLSFPKQATGYELKLLSK